MNIKGKYKIQDNGFLKEGRTLMEKKGNMTREERGT